MTLVSTERIYTGKVVNLDRDTVRFPDGSTGQLEMVRHPGASAVVPLLDEPRSPDPRVLLIQQFRHAADDFIWEIPAGRLDPGETPSTCAHRELEEETGMIGRRALPAHHDLYHAGLHRRADPHLPGHRAEARASTAGSRTSSWRCTPRSGRRS